MSLDTSRRDPATPTDLDSAHLENDPLFARAKELGIRVPDMLGSRLSARVLRTSRLGTR